MGIEVGREVECNVVALEAGAVMWSGGLEQWCGAGIRSPEVVWSYGLMLDHDVLLLLLLCVVVNGGVSMCCPVMTCCCSVVLWCGVVVWCCGVVL